MSKSISDLINHLKEHKDAVVIVGDKALRGLDVKTITEDDKEIFNRKVLVKHPDQYWNWYFENVVESLTTALEKLNADKDSDLNKNIESIVNLCNQDFVKQTISLSQDDKIDINANNCIALKGTIDKYECVKCDKVIFGNKKFATVDYNCTCGGRIRPSILMYNEKYNQKKLNDMRQAVFTEENGKPVLNTHTLILIGVDFEEDLMHDMLNSFKALKNSSKETVYSVIITEGDALSIDFYEPDFGTNYPIGESISKLLSFFGDTNE